LSILDTLAIVDDARGLVFRVTFASEGEVEPIRRAAERAAQAWGMCDVIVRN
jgi:hypothetical protein